MEPDGLAEILCTAYNATAGSANSRRSSQEQPPEAQQSQQPQQRPQAQPQQGNRRQENAFDELFAADTDDDDEEDIADNATSRPKLELTPTPSTLAAASSRSAVDSASTSFLEASTSSSPFLSASSASATLSSSGPRIQPYVDIYDRFFDDDDDDDVDGAIEPRRCLRPPPSYAVAMPQHQQQPHRYYPRHHHYDRCCGGGGSGGNVGAPSVSVYVGGRRMLKRSHHHHHQTSMQHAKRPATSSTATGPNSPTVSATQMLRIEVEDEIGEETQVDYTKVKAEATATATSSASSPQPGPSGLQQQSGGVSQQLAAPDLQLDCLLSSDTEDSSPEEDVTVVKISRRRTKKKSSSKSNNSPIKRHVVEVDLTQESDDGNGNNEDEIQVEMINNGASSSTGASSASTSTGGIKLRRFASVPQGQNLPPNVHSANSSENSSPISTPNPTQVRRGEYGFRHYYHAHPATRHGSFCCDPHCHGECVEAAASDPTSAASEYPEFLGYRPRRLRHPDFLAFSVADGYEAGRPPQVASATQTAASGTTSARTPSLAASRPHATNGCPDVHCRIHQGTSEPSTSGVV